MERRVVFVSNALQSAATLESPLPQIPDDKKDQVGNHAKKILKINIGWPFLRLSFHSCSRHLL
jgi:hypothetical protein